MQQTETIKINVRLDMTVWEKRSTGSCAKE